MNHPEGITNELITDFWLKLDNAAKMYPVLSNSEFTAVYRLSVRLKERVKILSLLQAVRAIENRFPYYKMQLKKGFFWYYLEHINVPITVQQDRGIMCRKFKKGTDNNLLIRILVKENRINIEFSHILTDGAGAIEFLKTLLITYFSSIGINIPENLNYIHPDGRVLKEELEDSYHKYFKKNIPRVSNLPKSFHLPYKLKSSSRFHTMTVILPKDQVKNLAKRYPVSSNIYLVAIYLYTLQNVYRELNASQQQKNNKILRIQVPVNLRNIFPSKSMRNFTLFILPEIDLRLGVYSFDEIIKKVYHSMELEKDEKLFSRIISRNVGNEKNKILRSIPLFIKKIILKLKYYSLGAKLYSGELTNMGKLDLTPRLNNLIDSVALVPPPPNKALKIDCGVIGFENKLVLTFGNITRSKNFEEKFLNILSNHGINYEIDHA